MDDAARLAELEAIIGPGKATFVAVGNALAEIRDPKHKLYRVKGYETFEAYCQEVWGFKRATASRIITSAEVVNDLVSHVKQDELPDNSRQAYELSRVPAEQRADVWEETLSRTNGKPTAKAVREVAEEVDLDASVADFHERNGGPPVVDVLDDADRAQLTLESFQAALRDAKNAARYIRDGFDRSRSTELRSEIQSIRALLDQLEGEIK